MSLGVFSGKLFVMFKMVFIGIGIYSDKPEAEHNPPVTLR